MITVTKTYWQVQIKEPNDPAPYDVGGHHYTLDGAIFYRDQGLMPRVGKRDGYRHKTEFGIVRYDLVRTHVVTIAGH
jgi:hypothetical protein